MILDVDLLAQVARAVIEPEDGSFPSGLWTGDEVYQFLTYGQQAFLRATHAQRGVALLDAVLGQAQYPLPDDWIATVRVVWRPTDGAPRELPVGDTLQADMAMPAWAQAAGTPRLFADAEFPTRTCQVMPAPDVAGQFELTYVPRAPVLTGSGESPTLPDTLTRAVLPWAALHGMLGKVARTSDGPRAAYCRDRLALAETATALLLKGFA